MADKWTLFWTWFFVVLSIWGLVVVMQQPTPQETDTGSEYDLIGNHIQRTIDLEMGNVCYARGQGLSCVKI